MVTYVSAIQKSIDENPYLTTCQIACGQGIGYRPAAGSADMAGTSYERLNYQALKESGIVMKGVHVITEIEAIADKIDELMKKTASRKDQP